MSKSAIGILLFFCWVQIAFFLWQFFLHNSLEENPTVCTEEISCSLGTSCVGGPEKDKFQLSSILRPTDNRDQSLKRISGAYERRQVGDEGRCWTWIDTWTGASE